MAPKKLILTAAALLAAVFCKASESLLELSETKDPDGGVTLRAQNRDAYAPRWVWVEFSDSDNVSSETSFPRGWTLPPASAKVLAKIKPRDPSRGYAYRLRSLDGIGDPGREPDSQAAYLLPWAHGTKHTLTQGYFGVSTHQDMRALDFDLREGTPVHASRVGVVVAVKQDSRVGGPGPRFAELGNYVHVLHFDATWAVYAHLQPGSVKVRLGQQVNAGQVLALSGHTGQAAGPHLHFAAYRATFQGAVTIPTRFKIGPQLLDELRSGRTYYAYHPGGKPFKAVLAGDLDAVQLRASKKTAKATGKVSFPETRVDQRTLLWCRNGRKRPVKVTVSLTRSEGVLVAERLPYQAVIPPLSEVFLFWIDALGDRPASWQAAYRIEEQP